MNNRILRKLVLIISLFFSLAMTAQESEKIAELEKRIEVLENKLAYLSLETRISEYSSNLKETVNGVDIKNNAISISILEKN